jgi:hypothetical protein
MTIRADELALLDLVEHGSLAESAQIADVVELHPTG